MVWAHEYCKGGSAGAPTKPNPNPRHHHAPTNHRHRSQHWDVLRLWLARGGDEAVTGTGKACPAVEKKYYIFREKGGVHPASNVTDIILVCKNRRRQGRG